MRRKGDGADDSSLKEDNPGKQKLTSGLGSSLKMTGIAFAGVALFVVYVLFGSKQEGDLLEGVSGFIQNIDKHLKKEEAHGEEDPQ